MSIPGVFPPVMHKEFCLVDGGVLNNFPVDLAKESYPKNKIIGIYLNQFLEDQKIKNIFDGLSLTYEILLR
jgi:predicted acylesterase/phospholipase RssA